MKTPTRFFLVCLGLAGLAVAADYAYLKYLESRVASAAVACEAESNRLLAVSADKASPNGDWRGEFAGLVCEPFDLATAGFDLEKIRPVQREVVEAYKKKESFETRTIGMLSAAMLVLIGILPLAWYFLLRRLREIGAAIRGE